MKPKNLSKAKKATWAAPAIKDIPIFFEVSLYSGSK
jgi:hypothetical protein